MQGKTWTALVITAFIVLGVLMLPACDLLGIGEEFEDVPRERLVALTAVYEKTDSTGTPIQRIVLVDFENPSNYKVITQNNHASIQPTFSPNKHRLVFGDKTTGAVHAPQLVLYDLTKGKVHPLAPGAKPGIAGPLVAPTDRIAWSANGKAIYFTNPHQAFSARFDVLYYRFADKHYERIHNGGGRSVYPVARKGGDTLIVFSNEKTPFGYYFMTLDGEYLSYIDNPHLELINRHHVNKKVATCIDWNNEKNLFAISYHDSTFSGYKIAVTNLDGSVYREYTSGRFLDDCPRWGPNNTVLFDRGPLGPSRWQEHRVMVVNIETGEVRELVEPEVIDGAAGLRFPDY